MSSLTAILHSLRSYTLLGAIATALLLGLSACGGGGAGGGGSNGGAIDAGGGTGQQPKEPNTSPGGGAVAETIVFSSQPSGSNTTANLAMFNQQGANGNAYVGPTAFSSGLGQMTFDEIFVKAQPGTTYQYKYVATPASGNAVLSMLNAQGSMGYLFKGNQTQFADEPVRSLFVKSSTRNTTYNWRLVEGVFNLDNLNKNGAEGYAYRGGYVIVQESKEYSLYVKENNSPVTFSYKTTPAIDSAADRLADMNNQGAQNFVYMGVQILGTSFVSLYEKNSASTKPTVFTSVASPAGQTTAQLIAKANLQGTQGYMYMGDIAFDAGRSVASFFYKGPASINPLNGPVLP